MWTASSTLLKVSKTFLNMLKNNKDDLKMTRSYNCYDVTVLAYMTFEASIEVFIFFFSSTEILSRIRLNFWIAWKEVATSYLDK